MESQFDRVELTRVLAQALAELGYLRAASTLESDSGIAAEHPAIFAMRSAIRSGDLRSAEQALDAAHQAGALQGRDGCDAGIHSVCRG